ncbi:hypothetical protein D3C76_1775000 [compost metagenome]
MPLLTPTYWFSAFWDSTAISTLSVGWPSMDNSAYAVTTSIEAEEDKPAPLGISPWKNKS